MKREELLKESDRCLKCKNPLCKNACPINTSIPEVIELFQKEEYIKGGEILFNNNPISLVCSLICPFEKQCMGSCIRGIKGEPVNFPEIENYVMNKYLQSIKFENSKSNGKKVAVVGAGPGGISAAFYLRKKGYEITIFDDHEKIGGMLRYGIPSFRLSKENVDLLEEKIYEVGIKFCGNRYFEEKDLKELKTKENFEAVLVATGAWLPKKLDLTGADKDKVLYGIDYLKTDTKLGPNKEVVVIGAGNVAMDVARTAKRQGNNVTIAYRRKLEEAPATKLEINDAKKDGVEFITEVVPIEISEEGILLENKNDKSRFLYKCDYILIAISQQSQFKIEDIDGYFYGGDLLTGPQTVVKASLTARESAKQLDLYLLEKE
ncbi:FAD-dependent oxidoreductase [Fusobacterium sp.]|uniref:FAD-dependent oxidoreductase n=1 Tax=Fusobacterium sp. TaxID=68766 RepID=UPI00261087A4|nr:FAD-dependent oxidoreductase [Fusobacterium sp.]